MEIVGQVEIDEFCNRVLAAHWPHVKRMRDIYEVHGDEFGAIDLVVAGFPCQPVSGAGKRRGQADVRWLWPEVCRIIRSARPAWCLLENVPGLISLGLDDVLGDLESAGYEAAACVYPAAAVGAPHERERIFIVAHTRCARSSCGESECGHTSHSGRGRGWTHDCGASGDVADTNSTTQPTQPNGSKKARRQASQRNNTGGCASVVANATRARLATGQPTRQPTNGTQSGTRMESEPAGLSGASGKFMRQVAKAHYPTDGGGGGGVSGPRETGACGHSSTVLPAPRPGRSRPNSRSAVP